MGKGENTIHGRAGRAIQVRQNALDSGLIVVEIQNAHGGHCASLVLTPIKAKELSDSIENQVQIAYASRLVAEMAVQK